MRPGRARLAVVAALLGAGVVTSPAAWGAKPAKKPAPKAAKPAPSTVVVQPDLSNTVEVKRLKNGALVWSLRRPGPQAMAALVVRAGAWNEDPGKPSAALAVARWVMEPSTNDYLLRFGTVLDFEMYPGGPAFTLRGPADKLPAAVAQLTKQLSKPPADRMARSRVRAVLEPRRYDLGRGLPDLARGLCWTGGSFELPSWGRPEDALGMLDGAGQSQFYQSWYQARQVTLVVVGPTGPGPFLAALGGLRTRSPDREALAPGQPGLPIHQVQHGRPNITMAGVVMPGLQNAGGALVLRARAAELLEGEAEKGRLAGPGLVDIVWTASHAVVYAAVLHPDEGSEQELAQSQQEQLKLLEDVLGMASEIQDADLNELRKREGARLYRTLAAPDGALGLLVPLATITDDPPDLRRAVLATPSAVLRGQLEETRQVRAHFSLRRLMEKRTR